MSQAEALLNSLAGTVVDHKHEVPDSDTHFIIDPYTRQIENTNYQKTVLMRGDHNSERFTFEVPRYVDGHDMSLCNRVIVHFDNVGDSIENVYSDVAYMDDLRINPDKPDTVISSWLIRREATQIVGILSFSLQYQCIENEEVTYEWNTDSYDDIEIRKSKNNGEAAVIQYTNVLEEWRSKIFGAGDSVMSNITTEGANQVTAVKNESASQQAAIELKGSETLATIPEDYTEVYNMASEAVRTKADSIICEAEGPIITVTDSSDDHIRGLNVYGKSTQVTTTGKNLFDIDRWLTDSGIVWSKSGYKYTINTKTPIYNTPFVFSDVDVEVTISCALTNKTTVNARFELLDSSDNIVGYFYEEHSSHTCVASKIRINWTTTGDVEISTPQIELGPTATNYEPYTGGMASPNPDYPQDIVSIENPTVEICGKNRARSNRDGVLKSLGVTITQVNNSSEIVIDGTTTGATSVTVFRDMYLRAGQYTLSVYGLNVSNESYDRAYMMDGNTNAIVNYAQTNRPQTFSIRESKRVSISIVFAEGTAYNNRTVRFQLEEGSAATEYEPYNGRSITLTNTFQGIQIYDGNTGNGFPIASNPEYADEYDSHWVCDSVDLERGVYVQRTNEYAIAGNETIAKSGDMWQKDDMFSVYINCLSPATEYASDDVGVFHCSISSRCKSNTWEWKRHDGLNNIAARKSIVYVSIANIYTGIRSDDTDEVKLVKMKNYLAAKYAAGTPITIRYILATPIETPLTAEEIETYKTLKTHYPNTTVLNNAGAWMKFKYNADTKLYINNAAVNGAVSVVEEVLNDTY